MVTFNKSKRSLVDVVSKNLLLIIIVALLFVCSFLIGPAFDHMLDAAMR
jgi:capsular polysaccharide biosynthesis protein